MDSIRQIESLMEQDIENSKKMEEKDYKIIELEEYQETYQKHI